VKLGRFLRERLRAKVLALVVGILLLGFGLLLALNLGRERHALE
jgi:threonine/homoserine/homoserine lactone efflux protein